MKRLVLTLLTILSVQLASAQFDYKEINYETHDNWNDMAQAMYDNILSTATISDPSGLYYEYIVDIPNVSKQDLMSRARIFFAENYVRGDAVIDLDDENAGVIIAKSLAYTVRVDIKDEKAKISVTPIWRAKVDDFFNKKGKFKNRIAGYYKTEHRMCLNAMSLAIQYISDGNNW